MSFLGKSPPLPVVEEKKSDHWYVGREDADCGRPRYKFQDAHLQKEYDKGYDSLQIHQAEYNACVRCNRIIPPGRSYCAGGCY